MTDADPVERLRAIATALPEVTEKLSHGEVSFFCRKQFVMLDDHHHGADHLAFWCAAPPGAQEELVASDPDAYRQVAPHTVVASLDAHRPDGFH